jgi:hypothetical protein
VNPSKATASSAPAARLVGRGFFARRDLATDFVLVLPVLLVYNLGLFLTGFRILNGVDFVTRYAVALLGFGGYLAFNAVAAIALVIGARSARRRSPLGEGLRPAALFPVLIESAVFALLMGGVIVTIMRAPFSLQLIASLGPVDRFVGSLGAGFFEEAVFRLGLLNLVYFVAERGLHIKSAPSWVIAIAVSSALFSMVHYVGFGADPFQVGSFVYRFLAGAYLAAVYKFRGFAVAVYTHAFYDLHVLLF